MLIGQSAALTVEQAEKFAVARNTANSRVITFEEPEYNRKFKPGFSITKEGINLTKSLKISKADDRKIGPIGLCTVKAPKAGMRYRLSAYMRAELPPVSFQECKDADFVTAHFDELVKISYFEEWIEENGLIRTFGKNPRCVIDWPPDYTEKYDFGEKREYLFVPNALAVKVMRQLAYLAEAIGRKDDAVRLRKKSEYMCCQLNELCYNRQTGLYTDRFGSENCSFHANMWALWCDLVPEERQDKVVDFVSASGMVCGLYSGFIYLETLFRYGKSRQATENCCWAMTVRG